MTKTNNGPAEGSKGNPGGSSGRNAACGYAIWLNGETSNDKILAREQEFVKYHERFDKNRNEIFHAGSGMIAGYYFGFGYYHAGLCAASTKSKEGAEALDNLVSQYLKFQKESGEWESHPSCRLSNTAFGLLLMSLKLGDY